MRPAAAPAPAPALPPAATARGNGRDLWSIKYAPQSLEDLVMNKCVGIGPLYPLGCNAPIPPSCSCRKKLEEVRSWMQQQAAQRGPGGGRLLILSGRPAVAGAGAEQHRDLTLPPPCRPARVRQDKPGAAGGPGSSAAAARVHPLVPAVLGGAPVRRCGGGGEAGLHLAAGRVRAVRAPELGLHRPADEASGGGGRPHRLNPSTHSSPWAPAGPRPPPEGSWCWWRICHTSTTRRGGLGCSTCWRGWRTRPSPLY